LKPREACLNSSRILASLTTLQCHFAFSQMRLREVVGCQQAGTVMAERGHLHALISGKGEISYSLCVKALSTRHRYRLQCLCARAARSPFVAESLCERMEGTQRGLRRTPSDSLAQSTEGTPLLLLVTPTPTQNAPLGTKELSTAATIIATFRVRTSEVSRGLLHSPILNTHRWRR